MPQSCGPAPTTKFEDVVVWRKAHAMVLAVYHMTARFPSEERFGLTSQFRRAAISVAANIAEGYRKRGRADKIRMLNVAEGSLAECQCYLLLSRDLGYADPTCLLEQADEVERLLVGYSHAIAARGA
ncbi:MAG TPA: four helix bundle protein [Bryobacteraceae bacterium]|nr:four helix bundle protein [Bryobacteraceae bacterium]